MMNTLATLANKVGRAFPDLAPVSTPRVLGEGFSSLVVETPAGIVFRIAKNHLAQRGHGREWRALPILGRSLAGLRLPQPSHYRHASPDFPHGLIGYPKLPGRPLAPGDITPRSRDALAAQIGAFLTALHRLSPGALGDLALPLFPPSPEGLDGLWSRTAGYLEAHLIPDEFRRVRAWWERLRRDEQFHAYRPTLVHADLWHENILFDPQERRIVGVIDFEHLALGDPAIDLATQSYLGGDFARAVLEHYDATGLPPANIEGRARTLLGLRELMGLEYGLLVGEVDADTLGKITAATINTEFQPPLFA